MISSRSCRAWATCRAISSADSGAGSPALGPGAGPAEEGVAKRSLVLRRGVVADPDERGREVDEVERGGVVVDGRDVDVPLPEPLVVVGVGVLVPELVVLVVLVDVDEVLDVEDVEVEELPVVDVVLLVPMAATPG